MSVNGRRILSLHVETGSDVEVDAISPAVVVVSDEDAMFVAALYKDSRSLSIFSEMTKGKTDWIKY